MNHLPFVYCLCFLLLGCGSRNDARNNSDAGWEKDREEKLNLNVMSYNIHHCATFYSPGNYGPSDVNKIAKVLKDKKPDVVLLQEVDYKTTRSGRVDQIAELARLAEFKYGCFFRQKEYQGGAYGAGMLSQYELKDIVNHELPKQIEGLDITGSHILGSARIRFNGKEIYFATLHLSVHETERLRQFPYMLEELEKLKGPVVVGGDFNSKPDHAIITLLDEAGFQRSTDDPTKFTIPSDRPNRKIDYIAFKPNTAFTILSHHVFAEIAVSDHLPIMTVLKPI